MIIGLLGKGGSGKSTVATQLALWLHDQGKQVLAVDADHNMDLLFNLAEGQVPDMLHLGTARADIFAHVGAPAENDTFKGAFLQSEPDVFSLVPADNFTEKYSAQIKGGLRLMAAGPQTEDVLGGGFCSHSLSAPLKTYLPLLKLDQDHAVVVDEKAGADGVSTGAVTGMDAVVVVVEPSLHSTKTAQQITELLDRFKVPFLIAANKISSPEDLEFIAEKTGTEITVSLSHSPGLGKNLGSMAVDWSSAMEQIQSFAARYLPSRRFERTKEKYTS